jgi:hypothetical protein
MNGQQKKDCVDRIGPDYYNLVLGMKQSFSASKNLSIIAPYIFLLITTIFSLCIPVFAYFSFGFDILALVFSVVVAGLVYLFGALYIYPRFLRASMKVFGFEINNTRSMTDWFWLNLHVLYNNLLSVRDKNLMIPVVLGLLIGLILLFAGLFLQQSNSWTSSFLFMISAVVLVLTAVIWIIAYAINSIRTQFSGQYFLLSNSAKDAVKKSYEKVVGRTIELWIVNYALEQLFGYVILVAIFVPFFYFGMVTGAYTGLRQPFYPILIAGFVLLLATIGLFVGCIGFVLRTNIFKYVHNTHPGKLQRKCLLLQNDSEYNALNGVRFSLENVKSRELILYWIASLIGFGIIGTMGFFALIFAIGAQDFIVAIVTTILTIAGIVLLSSFITPRLIRASMIAAKLKVSQTIPSIAQMIIFHIKYIFANIFCIYDLKLLLLPIITIVLCIPALIINELEGSVVLFATISVFFAWYISYAIHMYRTIFALHVAVEDPKLTLSSIKISHDLIKGKTFELFLNTYAQYITIYLVFQIIYMIIYPLMIIPCVGYVVIVIMYIAILTVLPLTYLICSSNMYGYLRGYYKDPKYIEHMHENEKSSDTAKNNEQNVHTENKTDLQTQNRLCEKHDFETDKTTEQKTNEQTKEEDILESLEYSNESDMHTNKHVKADIEHEKDLKSKTHTVKYEVPGEFRDYSLHTHTQKIDKPLKKTTNKNSKKKNKTTHNKTQTKNKKQNTKKRKK